MATISLSWGAASATEPAGAPKDAAALLGAFATMTGFEARFTEDKHLALLAAPLRSAGRLYFAAPGFLARHVETPRPSTVVITPTSLRYDDGTKVGHIDLNTRPDVRGFVASFSRVLAGDRAGLESLYTLRFTPADGPGGAWLLELTPKGESLGRLIKRLAIRGAGRSVHTIRVDETSGDHSVITIHEANPARTFSAEERARLFGPAPQ